MQGALASAVGHWTGLDQSIAWQGHDPDHFVGKVTSLRFFQTVFNRAARLAREDGVGARWITDPSAHPRVPGTAGSQLHRQWRTALQLRMTCLSKRAPQFAPGVGRSMRVVGKPEGAVAVGRGVGILHLHGLQEISCIAFAGELYCNT